MGNNFFRFEYTPNNCIFFSLLVEFNEIRFQDILPPPPGIRYSTISEKRLNITWPPQVITGTERVSGYEFLFKPSNTKIAYNLFIHPEVQLQLTTITSLTVDTSKDYEIFVAVLDADNGMPGYFQRILCKLHYKILDFHR